MEEDDDIPIVIFQINIRLFGIEFIMALRTR